MAKVDGKYSTQVYLDFFKHTFNDYKEQKNLETKDFAAIVYHLPFTKMGLKANRIAIEGEDEETNARLMDSFTAAKELNANVGNIYTGSLYLSLLSLLENGDLKAGDLTGLFSYGSGAMAEFYSANVVEGYEKQIDKAGDEALLAKRKKLSVDEYERIFSEALEDPKNDVELVSDEDSGKYYFAGIKDDIRQYQAK